LVPGKAPLLDQGSGDDFDLGPQILDPFFGSSPKIDFVCFEALGAVTPTAVEECESVDYVPVRPYDAMPGNTSATVMRLGDWASHSRHDHVLRHCPASLITEFVDLRVVLGLTVRIPPVIAVYGRSDPNRANAKGQIVGKDSVPCLMIGVGADISFNVPFQLLTVQDFTGDVLATLLPD